MSRVPTLPLLPIAVHSYLEMIVTAHRRTYVIHESTFSIGVLKSHPVNRPLRYHVCPARTRITYGIGAVRKEVHVSSAVASENVYQTS